MLRLLVVLAVAISLPFSAWAQSDQLTGNWREPGGSVIRVAPCGQDLCAQLVAISPKSPTTVDEKNPDPAKRSKPLCGLAIGYGFHLTGPGHAAGGQLYDPKSGKTYHGEMTAHDGFLELRGYVGIRAFGRSEQWTRADAFTTACPGS